MAMLNYRRVSEFSIESPCTVVVSAINLIIESGEISGIYVQWIYSCGSLHFPSYPLVEGLQFAIEHGPVVINELFH